MDDLVNVLQEIKKRQEIIGQELNEGSISYRVKLGKRKRAQEDVKELFIKYRESVMDKAVFILVTGDLSKEFVETSTKDFGCFALEAEGFYRDMMEAVNPRLYTDHPSSPGTFTLLESRFMERGADLGIISTPSLIFSSRYSKILKNEKDMLDLTARAFNECVGAELVGIDAIDKVSKMAIEKDFSGKIVPIVLFTDNEDLVTTLSNGFKQMFPNTFIVSSGKVKNKELKNISISSLKKVDTSSVEDSLVKVKQNLK